MRAIVVISPNIIRLISAGCFSRNRERPFPMKVSVEKIFPFLSLPVFRVKSLLMICLLRVLSNTRVYP